MIQLKFLFLTNVILFFVIHQNDCIKCWSCYSQHDPPCADPFDNATIAITDCKMLTSLPHLPNIPSTFCRKITQNIGGEIRILRSCGFLPDHNIQGDQKKCITKIQPNNITMEYCSCSDRDGCNEF